MHEGTSFRSILDLFDPVAPPLSDGSLFSLGALVDRKDDERSHHARITSSNTKQNPHHSLACFLRVLTQTLNPGSHTECNYKLMRFGVPVRHLPVGYQGDLKTTVHLKWLSSSRRIVKETAALKSAGGGTFSKESPCLVGAMYC